VAKPLRYLVREKSGEWAPTEGMNRANKRHPIATQFWEVAGNRGKSREVNIP
jgi:hypothetical protein